MSYHRLQTKPLNATLSTLMKRAAHVGLGVGAFTPILALANPTGGQVVAGQATIAAQNANNLLIRQASQSAIINWQQFSIGQGQYVQFLQPSSSSVVLNRVVGGNASTILGSLSANGQVFLVNPNGIFFGKGASLDVQGIIASTLDIANGDFMSGNYVFQKGSGAADAKVVNQGSIRTANGGYVVLAGDYSENDGLIQAESGHVVLASGARTTLTLSGNSLVNFAVDGATLSRFAGTENTGRLIADGGTVIMTADVANALKATVVNNTGLIEAQNISKNGGAIYLTATGGNIVNAGTLDADAGRAGAAGGEIVLKTDGFTNLTSASKISAAGIGANGGTLEISGRSINVRGSARLGQGGNMLLDPGTMSIVGGASSNKNSPGSAGNTTSIGKIGVGFIEGQLNLNANVNIAATKLIKETGVSSIAASGKGNLTLTVGPTGQITLGGVNIAIGGGLTANMSNGSFGFIQAKSVDLVASPLGVVGLHKASTSAHGKVSKQSVIATGGDIDISAFRVTDSGSNGILALKATGTVNLGAGVGFPSAAFGGSLSIAGKSVVDTKLINVKQNVTVNASGGNLSLGRVIQTEMGYGINATAAGGKLVTGSVAAYGGDIRLTDTTGNMSVGLLSAADNVVLNNAGHTLNFIDSGEGNATVKANHSGKVRITAATITQTGGDLLRISAGGPLQISGQIELAARSTGGSPHNPISHSLELTAASSIQLDHGIKNPGNVSIRAPHLAYTGASKSFSISAGYGNVVLNAAIGSATAPVKYSVRLVANDSDVGVVKSIYTAANIIGVAHNGDVNVGSDSGHALTLSAAGNVTLRGNNVTIGWSGGGANAGGVDLLAGQNATLDASDGTLRIAAQSLEDNFGGVKTTGIVVSAGNALTLDGNNVVIHAGNAEATASASASAGIHLIAARGNVAINGGAATNDAVMFAAGNALAHGEAGLAQTHKVRAYSGVRIVAGGGVSITGTKITASGGYGAAQAFASGSKAAMTADASASIFVRAKNGNISLTGAGLVQLKGGSGVGFDGSAFANGTKAKAVADANGGVELLASGGITVAAGEVRFSAGPNVVHQNSASHHQIGRAEHGGAASFDAVSSVLLNAGNGGIAVTAGSGDLTLKGGNSVFENASAGAGSSGRSGTFKGSATARVDLVTAGNINLSAHHNALIHAGNSAGLRLTDQGYGAASISLTADAGIGLNAGGSIDIAAGNSLGMSAGELAAAHAMALAHSGSHARGTVQGLAAINATAGGSVHAFANRIALIGGFGAASGAFVGGFSGSKSWKAAIAVNTSVNISAGASIVVRAGTLAGNGVSIHGGNEGAQRANVDADESGSAALRALSSVNLAAKGMLKILTPSFGSIHVHGGDAGASNAFVDANGSGAKATLTTRAGVNFTGSVVKILADNGSNHLSAGYGAALMAKAKGSYGGNASINADAGINIAATVHGITVRGSNDVVVRGGNSAAGGRIISGTSHNTSHHVTAPGSSSTVMRTVSNRIDHATAQAGNGGVAVVNGTARINLTAPGIVSFHQTGPAGGVALSAGYGAAAEALASVNHGGGAATVNGKSGVSINAGSLVVSGQNISVSGGDHAAQAYGTHVRTQTHFTSTGGTHNSNTSSTLVHQVIAQGAGAAAAVTADATVAVNVNTVALTAKGTGLAGVYIFGGPKAASDAHVMASHGGVGSINAKSGVSITAKTAFTASGANVFIGAGREDGYGAVLGAVSGGAKANLNVDASMNLTAPAITLTTGTHAGGRIAVLAGRQTAGHLQASAAGGSVAATVTDNTTLNAKGALLMKAASGDVFLGSIGEFAPSMGYGAAAAFTHVDAGAGGKAGLTVNSNLNLTGGSVHIVTGTFAGASHVSGGHVYALNDRFGDSNAFVGASAGGSAAHVTNTQMALTANAGALTIRAGSDILMGESNASSVLRLAPGDGALITANGANAKAALTANDTLSLSGATAVTLAAADDLVIDAASGPYEAFVDAGFKSQATMTNDEAVSIQTGGVFTASAGKRMAIAGAGRNFIPRTVTHEIDSDLVQATHAGAVATFTGLGSVSINAASVVVSGGSNAILAAGSGAGAFGLVGASYGGAATMTVNNGMNVTAKNAFTLGLTGNGAGGFLGLFAGSEAGEEAQVRVGNGGGKATLTADADINLTVTAATGTVTVSAGKHTGARMDVRGGGSLADGEPTAPMSFSHFVNSAGKGGSANANISTDLNVTAKGAIGFNAGAAGTLAVGPAGRDGSGETISAFNGGKAATTIQNVVSLNGGSVTFTAGNDINIFGASDAGHRTHVAAQSNGVASLKATDGLVINTKGAFTANAGNSLVVTTNGSSTGAGVGSFARVAASYGGATATLTATDTIQINAGTVSLKGGAAGHGRVAISAGSLIGAAANVFAMTRNDKATFNVDGSVTVNATGNFTVSAGYGLHIGGGGNAGGPSSSGFNHGHVSAGTSSNALHIPSTLATATMTVNSGVTLKAGGALNLSAVQVQISAAGGVGQSLDVFAARHGDVAQATLTGGINLSAASILINAKNGIFIGVDEMAGHRASVGASNGGQASLVATNGVNLSATGAITLLGHDASSDSVVIRAGNGAFNNGTPRAQDFGGGQATLQLNSGVGVHAGGSLSITAKNGGVEISGGYGALVSAAAFSGSATANVNANVSVTAGRALTVNAGRGSLTVRGGGRAGLVADLVPSDNFGTLDGGTHSHTPPEPAGTVTGNLNTGVVLTAGGNVSLTAFNDVVVAAGAGETLAVGTIRKFVGTPSTFGNSWGGGSANLSANVGAAVTAGRSLTVSAGVGTGGSGNVEVLGLGRNPGQSQGFYNIVSVRGGSSHAVANVSLAANAALTAGSNITINAALNTKATDPTGPSHRGNVLIDGGSIFSMRADHTIGNVTITGSANAAVTAGHDVVFGAVAGSIDVVAAHGLGGAEENLVDAHGNSGSATVTGNENATITAGHDIVTTTAIGGSLNVAAGQFFVVAAIGSASGQMTATGAANASLTAGDVINISGKGGLNVLGGFGDEDSATAVSRINSSSHLVITSDARRNASLQAKTVLSGANGVTLTFTGDGVVAGGDSVSAQGSSVVFGGAAVVAAFASVNANADVSTTITGKNIALTVGGSLLVRAGGSDKAIGEVFGAFNSVNYSVNADTNVTAGQNLTIKVGTGAVGDASFLGGNAETAHLTAGSSVSNHIIGTVHGDLNLSAGGNISIDVRGNLNVTGGQGLGASGVAHAGSFSPGRMTPVAGADGGLVTADLTAKTVFTAGGALAITLHGDGANLAGGGQAASDASVQAVASGASAARAVYNLDNSLTMQAGGAWSLTGAASGVTINTELVASRAAGPFTTPIGPNTSVSVQGNSSVTLSGKTLNVNNGNFTRNAAGTAGFSSPAGGSSVISGHTYALGAADVFLNGNITLLSGGKPIPAAIHAVEIKGAGGLKLAPLQSGLSFGAQRSLSELPSASISVTPAAVQVGLGAGVTLLTDGSAQHLGTVQSQSPVLSLVTIAAPAAGSPQLQPGAVTLFDPSTGSAAATGSGVCTALVLKPAGGYRCGAGGR